MPKKIQPQTFEEHLGAAVRSYMTAAGETQEQVAATIGVPITTFGRHLRGASGGITARELALISAHYATDAEPASHIAARIVAQALRNFGGIDKLMSEGSSIPDGASKDWETRYLQGAYGIAAQRRDPDEPDEATDDT